MTGILWFCITLGLITLAIKLDQEGALTPRTYACQPLTDTSSNMIPKQHEMDGIVKSIYEAMTNKEHLQSTLLVLCGDHGMNDAGNHGGSAPGETSPALVFVSPKLRSINSGRRVPASFEEDFQYYSTVEQSDIAPTLGSLLGFPAPRNNLGAIISDFLPFWPKSQCHGSICRSHTDKNRE